MVPNGPWVGGGIGVRVGGGPKRRCPQVQIERKVFTRCSKVAPQAVKNIQIKVAMASTPGCLSRLLATR